MHTSTATSPRISLDKQRRRANRLALRVVKLRENSRWFHDYGPIMLIDADRSIVTKGLLDADHIAEFLDDWER